MFYSITLGEMWIQGTSITRLNELRSTPKVEGFV